MLLINEYAESALKPIYSVSLPFDVRQKARFVAQLDNGLEAGFQLKRGRVLRDGDKLLADSGEVILVVAKNEELSTVSIEQSKLPQVCYHLGNRHVVLQISALWCRYQRDHVLDDMVKRLGAKVVHDFAPFEPEPGAYHAGRHHD